VFKKHKKKIFINFFSFMCVYCLGIILEKKNFYRYLLDIEINIWIFQIDERKIYWLKNAVGYCPGKHKQGVIELKKYNYVQKGFISPNKCRSNANLDRITFQNVQELPLIV
jgi:hypothetical protein